MRNGIHHNGAAEDGSGSEMYKLMDDGITSFKPFMAHPGVFLAVDATIFRAMSAAETQLSVALYITAV